MFRRFSSALLVASVTFTTAGCAPVLISALGVGAGAAVSHHMNGMGYRTFTFSLPRVHRAVIVALKKMSIKPEATEKIEGGERISAKAGGRNIEIELEVLTPSATRMRTVARSESGLTVDSSTATEIINQTEAAVAHSKT